MKNLKLSAIGMSVIMILLLSLAGGPAFGREAVPMKPEMAAKKENVRKQREQRVTDTQRKTAADALKEERRKVHMARQLVKKSKSEKHDNK